MEPERRRDDSREVNRQSEHLVSVIGEQPFNVYGRFSEQLTV